jgi:rod shape-determining protein MreC
VATRSRSARAAVLASSVQRSKSTPYPSKARSALIRKAVVVVLVLVALTLITISFRSPTSGALHGLQGAGSTALRPFQIAATRVAQPFRDGYDYVHSLATAKSELEHEKRLYVQVRRQSIANRAAAIQARQVEKLAHFEQGARFPNDYRFVNTGVITPPGGPFAHTLVIESGSSSGVRLDSPVVSGAGGGLVGIVTNVFPDTATVTLLSDPNSFVAALDLHTQVRGMIHTGPSGTLILDQVQKAAKVKKGDELITTGTRSARYPDLYPYGIPIGRVTNVGATDTAVYLQVQVQPFANLGALSAVAVLVPKKPHR